MTGDADGLYLRQLAEFVLALSVKVIENAVNEYLNSTIVAVSVHLQYDGEVYGM